MGTPSPRSRTPWPPCDVVIVRLLGARIELDEPYRRQGVGRRLLEAFMEAGRSAGASKMFLTTGEANMPARRLYEALGGGVEAQGPTVNYWFLLRS